MNERIKELADQALKACDAAKERGIEQYSKRLAELIVRECARAVDAVYENAGPDYGCYDWTTFAYGSDVLKHFGVE